LWPRNKQPSRRITLFPNGIGAPASSPSGKDDRVPERLRVMPSAGSARTLFVWEHRKRSQLVPRMTR